MKTEMIADYKAGLTLREIAKKYYVSHTYIYHHIPKDLRRQKKMTAYHKDVIKDYESGMPVKEIAQKHDITYSYVHMILKGNNIALRKGRRG